MLQRTGSFKIRGAYNRLKQLVENGQTEGGVVAFSSGNHAQGVAEAARLLGMKAAIVMPGDAPALKIDNTRRLGGEVILYDRWTEDREAICARVAAERGATVVPSFDDAGVIAGQGTVGLEMAADARALGLALDSVYVPASGGGLAAGIGLALDDATALYTAEPAAMDDHATLAQGRRAVGQRSGGALDLRRAAGADAGADHLCAEPQPAGRRRHGHRRRGAARHGLRL